jgi:hypothetical protein
VCFCFDDMFAGNAWPESDDEEEEGEEAGSDADGTDGDHSDSHTAAAAAASASEGHPEASTSGVDSLEQSLQQLSVGNSRTGGQQQRQHQTEGHMSSINKAGLGKGSSGIGGRGRQHKAERGPAAYMDESLLPPSCSESDSEGE